MKVWRGVLWGFIWTIVGALAAFWLLTGLLILWTWLTADPISLPYEMTK